MGGLGAGDFKLRVHIGFGGDVEEIYLANVDVLGLGQVKGELVVYLEVVCNSTKGHYQLDESAS